MQPTTLFNIYLKDLDKYNSIPSIAELLHKYNLGYVFKPILNSEANYNSKAMCIAVATIVMTYSKDSTWLNFERPLDELNETIRNTLVERMYPSTKVDEDEVNRIVHPNNQDYQEAKINYITYQKDNTFYRAASISEHIANCYRQGTNIHGATDKMMVDKTKYFNETKDLQDEVNILTQKIKSNYSKIDEILTREGKPTLSDSVESPNSLFAAFKRD